MSAPATIDGDLMNVQRVTQELLVHALTEIQRKQAEAAIRGAQMSTESAPVVRPRTIHEPNNTAWKPGDLVIHDSDAKRPDMLMVVTGCSKAGTYRTRYAFPAKQPKQWRRKIWRNTMESLHDPRRFGIALKSDPAAPLTLDAVRTVRR